MRERHRAALPSQKTLAGEREDERYRKGLEIQAPLYGDGDRRPLHLATGEFAQAVPRFLTELCCGDFNTRSGLDGKTRELLTVVLLAALGGAEVQLKSHVQGALRRATPKRKWSAPSSTPAAIWGIPACSTR